MKIYTGCDIEANSRFEGRDEKFLNRLFTPQEIEYSRGKSNASEHFTARFCAKEAVFKALSSGGVKGFSYKDIEVINDENGAPRIRLLKEISVNVDIEISLSHCDKYSMASAILVVQDF